MAQAKGSLKDPDYVEARDKARKLAGATTDCSQRSTRIASTR